MLGRFAFASPDGDNGFMIDRRSRDEMGKAIRDYMEERIAAFDLADSLDCIAHATKDETVKLVGKLMWFHYDDLKDHKIVASKQEWDYFNRLLLLLESEVEAEFVKTHASWRAEQAVAALCLAGFVFVALRSGFGKSLFVYTLLSGAVSMLLVRLRLRGWEKPSPAKIAITPFPSIASLLSIRRRVTMFARKRYPKSIAGRRIRNPFVETVRWIPTGVLWLVFSPIVLLIQMLPHRQLEPRIEMPKPERAAR